jgi:hypothetical protein
MEVPTYPTDGLPSVTVTMADADAAVAYLGSERGKHV